MRHPIDSRSERGAVTVLLTALIVGLMAAALWASNAAGLVAVRREVVRAADLAALSGAAALPLVGAFDSGEPHGSACRRAEALLAPAAAPLGARLSSAGRSPTCPDGVTVEAVAEWGTPARVRDALASLLADLGLLTPDLCLPLVSAALDPWLATLTATDCARLQTALDGLADNLSPALLTPRVHVRVAGTYEALVPVPEFAGSHAISADATARRRFKNLVVLPAVRTGTGGAVPALDALDGAPAPLDAIDPNPTAAGVRDVLLPLLWQANTALASHLNPLLPPGYTFDLSGLILDVADLYDPPTGATPPSPVEVVAEAARTGDPLVVLRLFRMPVLGIPALDFTAAYVSPLADGRFEATPIPVGRLAGATGLFGASLVR